MENLKFKTEQIKLEDEVASQAGEMVEQEIDTIEEESSIEEIGDWRSLKAEAPDRVNELIQEINPNFDQLPTVERVVILRELLNTYNISDRESRPANFNQYRYIVPIIASRLKFEEERAKAEMFTSSLAKSWN